MILLKQEQGEEVSLEYLELGVREMKKIIPLQNTAICSGLNEAPFTKDFMTDMSSCCVT